MIREFGIPNAEGVLTRAFCVQVIWLDELQKIIEHADHNGICGSSNVSTEVGVHQDTLNLLCKDNLHKRTKFINQAAARSVAALTLTSERSSKDTS